MKAYCRKITQEYKTQNTFGIPYELLKENKRVLSSTNQTPWEKQECKVKSKENFVK